jgi:uncharacterized protein
VTSGCTPDSSIAETIMSPADLVDRTVHYVRTVLAGEGSGHDWWHVYRVWKMAQRIGQAEDADLLVVELAALLHDIADWKFCGGDCAVGPKVASAWLTSLNVDPGVSDHVSRIIADISFKGAGVEQPTLSLEGQVVQDADRLDAMGAIGIARAFAYGGAKGRLIHDPAVKPEEHRTAEAYLKSGGSTVNHFYEKLLLLKDRTNTATGRAIAEERHAFMEDYLRRFFKEWEGG